MPDIDLEPTEYRVKRGSIRRFVSSSPYRTAMIGSGIWAGGVLYTGRNWVDLGPTWLVLCLAAIPAAITLLVWVLNGGGDRHD